LPKGSRESVRMPPYGGEPRVPDNSDHLAIDCQACEDHIVTAGNDLSPGFGWRPRPCLPGVSVFRTQNDIHAVSVFPFGLEVIAVRITGRTPICSRIAWARPKI
jgi:hypothetical protein